MHNGNKIVRACASGVCVIAGNVLYALTARLFLIPSGLITGGTTGIALAMNHYLGISVSLTVLIFGVAMLLMGLLLLGKQFAITTVISTFTFPAFSAGVGAPAWGYGTDPGYLFECAILRTWNWAFAQYHHSFGSVQRRNGYPPVDSGTVFENPCFGVSICF